MWSIWDTVLGKKNWRILFWVVNIPIAKGSSILKQKLRMQGLRRFKENDGYPKTNDTVQSCTLPKNSCELYNLPIAPDNIDSDWWYTYASEKYDFVSWMKWHSQLNGAINSCSRFQITNQPLLTHQQGYSASIYQCQCRVLPRKRCDKSHHPPQQRPRRNWVTWRCEYLRDGHWEIHRLNHRKTMGKPWENGGLNVFFFFFMGVTLW